MNKQLYMPKHIAIIMDGNRRWAKDNGLPIVAGHQKVAKEILEPLIEHAAERGISYITFWAWSTENWKRNSMEINAIMRIFRNMISDSWENLHKKGVKIRVIGDPQSFDRDIREGLMKVEEETKNNSVITAVFALNYGGRDEIIRAIIKLEEKIRNSKFEIRNLHTKTFTQFLDTSGIPDPEMIVRTGGEQRLSGFYLWQSEYSELFFPRWFMPEFTPEKLDELLAEYSIRSRRFGQ